MATINFDVIPELIQNAADIRSIFIGGFLDVMQAAGSALKNTEQDEPVVQETIENFTRVERNFNALMEEYAVHAEDLEGHEAVRERLGKQTLSIDIKELTAAGITGEADASEIRNL